MSGRACKGAKDESKNPDMRKVASSVKRIFSFATCLNSLTEVGEREVGAFNFDMAWARENTATTDTMLQKAMNAVITDPLLEEWHAICGRGDTGEQEALPGIYTLRGRGICCFSEV